MVLLENPEMMALMATQDLEDHLAITAVMQLSEIVRNAHHTLPPKDFKVLLVNQEMMVYPAGLENQVLLVNLVDAFLEHLEHLEEMVNQVMMEQMAYPVDQASLEAQEMLLVSKRVPVQISSSV